MIFFYFQDRNLRLFEESSLWIEEQQVFGATRCIGEV
jgi:hypothetical protein